jgi:hypothetical protein
MPITTKGFYRPNDMGSKRITALVEFEKTRVILYRFTINFSHLSSIILLTSPILKEQGKWAQEERKYLGS